jgi:hypothetical protein
VKKLTLLQRKTVNASGSKSKGRDKGVQLIGKAFLSAPGDSQHEGESWLRLVEFNHIVFLPSASRVNAFLKLACPQHSFTATRHPVP